MNFVHVIFKSSESNFIKRVINIVHITHTPTCQRELRACKSENCIRV